MFVLSHINSLHIYHTAWDNVPNVPRFLTTANVVQEELNNCLPNNKWFNVKYVTIVFG